MTRRLLSVGLILSALLLACFGRLAADPSALIVDADHPSVGHARRLDRPSIGNDLTRLFLPHHLAIARSIARFGHVPLWDDRGFGGRPLVGNPQAGLFYPPTWIAWWSGAPSSLGWITVGHLLWAGLGTYRLARTLGMGGWGSLVSAGCVLASPYVLAQTFEGHYPHVWAACWYPWAFDAAIRLRRAFVSERMTQSSTPLPEGEGGRGSPWFSALSLPPILAATFLAGHPQEGYYLLIALGSWACWYGLAAIWAGRSREAMVLGTAWAGILALAVGLIGIELVPDAMAQDWGLRWSKLPLRLASRYHLDTINVLQLLGPRALGGPADYFGHDNYWESVTSIGLIPLSLAIIAVAWSPDRRAVRGWLVLVAASLLFASGRKLGLFAVLFEVVPGMDRFRVPSRSLFLASLGASILAGLGVETLRARSGEPWGRLVQRSGTLAAFLAVIVLTGRGLVDRQEMTPHRSTTKRSGRVPEIDRMLMGLSRLSADPSFWLALGGMTGGLALARRRPGDRKAIAAALGLLGLVELGFHGHALIVTSPASRFLGPDPISEALLRANPPGLEPPRIRAVDALYDDLRAGQIGFSKTNVGDSFQVQHAADLYETLYHLFEVEPFDRDAIAGDLRKIRQGVLDRMGVSLLVSDRLDLAPAWPILASGLRDGSTFAVLRNPTALPRAYVVPRVKVVPDDVSTVARFSEVDPREAVLMPVDPLGPDRTDRQPFTPAEWSSTDPDRVVLRVSTEAPGLLVVADTWMPGWLAEVDGKAAPVLRGNRAQRVIPLTEPGRHEVVLRYRPPGLALGVALTSGSALVWMALLIGLKVRSIRTPPASGTGRGPRRRR